MHNGARPRAMALVVQFARCAVPFWLRRLPSWLRAVRCWVAVRCSAAGGQVAAPAALGTVVCTIHRGAEVYGAGCRRIAGFFSALRHMLRPLLLLLVLLRCSYAPQVLGAFLGEQQSRGRSILAECVLIHYA